MADVVNFVLVLLSSAGFLAAIFFTYRLSQETRGGQYWLAFLVAAAGLGSHEWLKIVSTVFSIHPTLWNTIVESGMVVGSFALAYGAYGIQKSVKKIKTQVGD
ncbi:MAG: hypothetical protein SV186_01855 [Candidatus Nanohaloarchaea archaeon]|nr:hypothetical protein [Candidatus Nanohaloarchaea archaeon]